MGGNVICHRLGSLGRKPHLRNCTDGVLGRHTQEREAFLLVAAQRVGAQRKEDYSHPICCLGLLCPAELIHPAAAAASAAVGFILAEE